MALLASTHSLHCFMASELPSTARRSSSQCSFKLADTEQAVLTSTSLGSAAASRSPILSMALFASTPLN
eukprot:1742491-Alexandrium_andersonii.AAC.1